MTLKEYRAHLGITAQQMADTLNIEFQYYKSLEYNQAQTPLWIKRIIKEYEDANK